MGLFSSMGRFFSNLFGLASGALDEASDSMVSGSPGAIKAQFRNTREEWLKQYNEMRDAVSQLMVVREQKKNEMEKLQDEEDDLEVKMDGALNEAEASPENVAHQEAYERFYSRKLEIDARQEQLTQEIQHSETQLEDFKGKLRNFQEQIKKLEQEEAETIADIVSSQKIIELNDRINKISTDNVSQSLEAIRSRREKLKAKANLSSELSNNDINNMEDKYRQSGKKTAASEAFLKALKARKKTTETPDADQKEEETPPSREL